jgi:hypothetical protein
MTPSNEDERPPREARFVPAANMPLGNKLVSLYDHNTNLLVINKELFDGLSPADQQIVLCTEASSIELRDGKIVELSFDPQPIPTDCI